MTTGTPPGRSRVFISYSRKDRDWVERVRLHLRPLERDHGLGADVWDDSEIEAGADWLNEIKDAVASTRAVVLLASAAFLASDFIESNELPPLLDAARREGVRILPVHVKPSRFLKTPGLSHFQSVNDPAHPLIGLTEAEQERVLVKLADAVEHAFTQTAPAVRHYEAAAVSGVVAGEHPAPANAAAALREQNRCEEEKVADAFPADALEAPLRRMAEGWGRDGDETLRAVRLKQKATNNPGVGYYGEEDSVVDLFEAGAVVPAEYVGMLMREAVEAAAGRIASLRFTDEVVREVAALEGRQA